VLDENLDKSKLCQTLQAQENKENYSNKYELANQQMNNLAASSMWTIQKGTNVLHKVITSKCVYKKTKAVLTKLQPLPF